MKCNMLKLNDDKSEFNVIKSKTFVQQGVNINIVNAVLRQRCCQKMLLLLRNIARNCIISEEECKIIVHTLDIPRLDQCNVPLYGVAEKTLHIVQYYAAYMMIRFGKSEHITPVLRYLHQFPVELWVDYKILLYTYNHFIIMRRHTLMK